MKTTLSFIAIATFTMLFQACEKQDWKETKMFHDVPKRAVDAAPEHAKEAAPAAEHK
jgi:hypothetical protein